MQMTLVHHAKDISLTPALHGESKMLFQTNLQLVSPVNQTIYACPKCGNMSTSMDDFKNHIRSVHLNLKTPEKIICKICRKKYQTVKSLRRHEKTHQKNVPQAVKVKDQEIPCPQCPKRFSNQTALHWHVERNHTENAKTNTCKLCSKEFADHPLLKRHLEAVHPLETATCTICKKTFKSNVNLQRHMAVTHPPEQATQTCDICYKTFKCSTHLRIHIRTVHTAPAVFNCDICNKEFSQKKYLQKHRKTHVDVKEIQCRICYQVYKTVADARRHEKRVHMKTEESNNLKKCDICDKEFTRTKYLVFHKKTHVDKKLSCNFCHKLFKCTSHVNKHTRRVHLKTRKDTDVCFYCDICKKSFTQKKNLAKHIKIHIFTKKETPCGICNKLFKTTSDVNRHVRKVHMKNMDIREMILRNRNMKNMKISTPAETNTRECMDNALRNTEYIEKVLESTKSAVKALEVTEFTNEVPRSEDYRLVSLGNTEYTAETSTEHIEELSTTDPTEALENSENITKNNLEGMQISDKAVNEHTLENTEYVGKVLQTTTVSEKDIKSSEPAEDSNENVELTKVMTSVEFVDERPTNMVKVIENKDPIEALEKPESEHEDIAVTSMNDMPHRSTDIIKAAIENSDFTIEDLRMTDITDEGVLSAESEETIGSTDLIAAIESIECTEEIHENTLHQKHRNRDIIKAAIEISDFTLEDLGIADTEDGGTQSENKVITGAVNMNEVPEDFVNTDFIEALGSTCSETTLGNTDIIKDAIESSNFTIEDLGLTEYTEDPLPSEYTIEDFGITECTETLENTAFADKTLTTTDFIEKALTTVYTKEPGTKKLTQSKTTIDNTDFIEALASAECAKEVSEFILDNPEFSDQALASEFFIDVLGNSDYAKKNPVATKFTGNLGGTDFVEQALKRTDFTEEALRSTVSDEDLKSKDLIQQVRESIEYAKHDESEFADKAIGNTDIIKEAIQSSNFTMEDFGAKDAVSTVNTMKEIKECTDVDLKSIEIKLLKCLKCGIDFENDVDLHTHLCGGEMALFLDF